MTVTRAALRDSSYIDYRHLAIEMATRIAPDLQETMESTIQVSLNRLQTKVQSHTDRLQELEQRASSLEDDNATLQAKLNSSASVYAKLSEKVEYLENRSRHNNLRLVGLPETISNMLNIPGAGAEPCWTLNVEGKKAKSIALRETGM